MMAAGVSSEEVGRAGTSSIGSASLFSMVESLKDGASIRVRGAECLDADVYDLKGSKEKSAFCIVCKVKIKIIKFLNLYVFECARRYSEVGNKGTISGGSLSADVSCMRVNLWVRMGVRFCDTISVFGVVLLIIFSFVMDFFCGSIVDKDDVAESVPDRNVLVRVGTVLVGVVCVNAVDVLRSA